MKDAANNGIATAEKCSKRCNHRLVWTDLPNGKRTQVQECRTERYRAQSAAAVEAFRNVEIPADLLALVYKACTL